MDRESIIKEVVNTEKEIGKLIAELSSNIQNFSRIDIDLTLEKLRKLYDMILQLKDADIAVVVEKQEEKAVPAKAEVENDVEEKAPQQIKKEKEEAEESSFETEKEVIQEKEIIKPKVEESAASVLFEVETEKEVKPEDTEKPKKEESVPAGVTMDLFGETVADKVAPGNDKTIAESISENMKEKSVADVINKTPVDDLKAAIGINEKFFFINELFDGNMKDYNEAIDKLNGFENKDEALGHFGELKERCGWNIDNEAVGQLMELIGRRFGN